MSQVSFVRQHERLVHRFRCTTRIKDVSLSCVLCTIEHGEEGALVLQNLESREVLRCVPIYDALKTNIAQLTNGGFRCVVLQSPFVHDVMDFETDNLIDLRTFVSQTKRFVAFAEEMHLRPEVRSHSWLSFYQPVTRDSLTQPEGRHSNHSSLSTTPSLDSTYSDHIAALENPFFSGSPTESISSFTNKGSKKVHVKSQFFQSAITQRRVEYTKSFPISVKVVTWNVAGCGLPSDLSELFYERSPCDVYFLAFQEVDSSADAYLTATDTKAEEYKSAFGAVLDSDYTCIASHQLVGIFACIYVRSTIAEHISDIEQSYVATGLLAILGNKGGVGIKFKLGTTNVAFVNAHLAAGQNTVEKRNLDLSYIQDRLFNERGYLNSALIGLDAVFLCGDLNYRLATSRDAAMELILNQDWDKLLQVDQLSQQRRIGTIMQDWHEESIDFAPTYKFDIGTQQYDTSEKQRVPSWTDRIFCKALKHDTIMPCARTYRSLPTFTQSDHKPVTALFTVQTELIEPDKYATVRQQVLKELDKYENEALPRIQIHAENELDYGNVYYERPTTKQIRLENIGVVAANFHFTCAELGHSDTAGWIWPMPIEGVIMPGQSQNVAVTICVDKRSAQILNNQLETLSTILIVRLHEGQDCYIAVTGLWQRTCISNKLQNLAICRGVRSSYARADPIDNPSSIPQELYRICSYLTQDIKQKFGLFTVRAEAKTMDILLDSLDEDRDFPNTMTRDEIACGLCELLIDILSTLEEPVIPTALYQKAIANGDALEILDLMPSLNANVLIYLKGFITTVIMQDPHNKSLAQRMCTIFGNALLRKPVSQKPGPSIQAQTTSFLHDYSVGERARFIRRLIDVR